MSSYSAFIQTPAKVNLGLKIVCRRADGYHDIHTVMEPITLADSLYCEFTEGRRNRFVMQCPQLANLDPADNLVVRAARLIFGMAQEQGCRLSGSWNFFLDKKIPFGAGLGGGSSNAAGVVRLFDKFYGLHLSSADLCRAAAAIGADVPFFINPELSLVEGIGDRITPLGRARPRYYLLVKPPFPINTAWAYAALQAGEARCPVEYDCEQFKAGAIADGYALENDFEAAVMTHHPLLAELKQWLLRQSGVLGALMSGSGSVVYAVFADLPAAIEAETAARRQFAGLGCRFFLARNLITFT
ncbi:MAG: 4-(cytidine 5'-diphospho)-2-C-methyl-D-erythritol kinase [Deltaproteobacteria bacterium]|nr:4-(cytidine 5'-diphospho)-2-C-methyl-D-erythritol kinase [Deltaproteobacteria bacterium]